MTVSVLKKFRLSPRHLGVVMSSCVVSCVAFALTAVSASAQTAGDSAWSTGVEVRKTAPATAPAPSGGFGQTTIIERLPSAGADGPEKSLKLVALLTADGQQIEQGLVWRVFQDADGGSKPNLVSESRDASPAVSLKPGAYTINAAFGRAHITRRVSITPETATLEPFVLNAGGLRVTALSGGQAIPNAMVTYAIYSDDRDQYSSRTLVMSSAKPNLIIRLNAGLYRIVSQYGDANAQIETDITVEAGKLTEATVTHPAGRAMFKLVTRENGEALPGTSWTIQTSAGGVVKESVGALPSHYLAPGAYVVTAKAAGQMYRRSFDIKDGDMATVEVLRDAATSQKQDTSTLPLDIPSTTLSTGDFNGALDLRSR